MTKEFTIMNEHGLHARPASLFCNTASKFSAEVRVKREGSQTVADGKSVISILMLEVSPGSRIEVTAEGEDEAACLEAIGNLIGNNFNE